MCLDKTVETFKPLYIDKNKVKLLDQRILNQSETWLDINDGDSMIEAISGMAVRGAPAIGIAGAYGMWLYAQSALKDNSSISTADILQTLKVSAPGLANARPTAVNLSWAVERILHFAESLISSNSTPADFVEALKQEAIRIHDEDIDANMTMGDFGSELLRNCSNALTHCNAGALATGGHGTALGVFYSAWAKGMRFNVWVDETRPFLQGARLTAWELGRAGVSHKLICDNMAGYLMKNKKVDVIITGADRIAVNGDAANKIGTYSVAVLARAHGIPFYIAAPLSTFDINCPDGNSIPIEERAQKELTHINDIRITAEKTQAFNPGFDVTPAEYIKAIITEKGLVNPDEQSIRTILKRSK